MNTTITTIPAPAPAGRLCPLCRGTGSGLYNVLSDLPVCEACGGAGEQSAGSSATSAGLELAQPRRS